MSLLRRLLLGLLVAVVISACANTEKRYERAAAAEASGDWVAAAEAYISVLEADRSFQDAALRLRDVGPRAMDFLYDSAGRQEASGDFENAITILDRMRNLAGSAANVGVALDLPADLDERYDFYVEAALDKLTRDAEAAVNQGNLERARQLLVRARSNFQMDADRRADLDHRLGAVLVSLAQRDLDDFHYRSAFATANEAVEILDVYDDDAELQARGIAMSALAQGVRKVVVVPFWRTDVWDVSSPPGLRTDINEALTFGEVNRRPPFIEITNPNDTDRMVRSLGLDRRSLSSLEMRDLAEELESDFVVSGELSRYLRTDDVRRSRTREARTRGRSAVDTTYTWMEVDVESQADAVFRILDRRTRTVIFEGTASAKAEHRVERAEYAGDWRTLDVSASVLRLLDPQEWARQDRELMIALAEALAEDIMLQADEEILPLIQ